MANQAPSSAARRQPGDAVDEIDALLGLHNRPARPRRFGPRQQKHYFISHGDRHLPPGDRQGIDHVLIATGAPLEVPESVRITSAGQTFGPNVQAQRPNTSQMMVLDASPPDSGFGRFKAWAHAVRRPADLIGTQQDALSVAVLQNALAKLEPGENRARTFTVYVRQTEPEPPPAQEDVRQNWKTAFDIFTRAMLVKGIPNRASEPVDLVEYLISRNVSQTTPALPTDAERAYRRIVEFEVATQEDYAVIEDLPVEAMAPAASTIEANYQQRIAELEEIAEEEDISFSSDSTQDFWLFIKDYRPSPQAGLILTDYGHLVAIWRDDAGGNIEVEFLGDQQCKMIVFKDPKDPLRVLPEISIDTLASIGQHVGELSFLQSDQ